MNKNKTKQKGRTEGRKAERQEERRKERKGKRDEGMGEWLTKEWRNGQTNNCMDG